MGIFELFWLALFVGLIAVGPIIASRKGFAALRWLPLGILGLIVVLSLPSAKAQDITKEESAKRAAKANKLGAWMCGIILAFFALCALFFIFSAPPAHRL